MGSDAVYTANGDAFASPVKPWSRFKVAFYKRKRVKPYNRQYRDPAEKRGAPFRSVRVMADSTPLVQHTFHVTKGQRWTRIPRDLVSA